MPLEIQIDHSMVKRFAVLKEKQRLAHAYLFIGPAHIGKGETALEIAKLINCETGRKGKPCDACPSCMKINSGNHPDICIIDNGSRESIKIEQIRELLSKSKLRPFLAMKKIFIIKNIENLTLESANAFLKTLEEPSGNNLLLLTTSVPEKNLDTIKSRCHQIYFQPLSNKDLVSRLQKDYHVDEDGSHFLAYFSQGCLGTAQKLNDEQFIERKNRYIEAFILSHPSDLTVKEILADKDQVKELLEVLLSWIRDAMLVKAGVDDSRLIHLGRIHDLKNFQDRFSFSELKDLNQSIVHMCRLLSDNLNIKLPFLILGEQLWEK